MRHRHESNWLDLNYGSFIKQIYILKKKNKQMYRSVLKAFKQFLKIIVMTMMYLDAHSIYLLQRCHSMILKLDRGGNREAVIL